MHPDALQVFWAALLTDLATGIGALPFFFVRVIPARWQGASYSVAGGMMISAAVFSLAEQGLGRDAGWETIAGMLAGAFFFWGTARWVEGHPGATGALGDDDTSRLGVLMLVTMFIHSIPEGIAIGVGYATGELEFGVLLATAIAVHNIPEGIAISLPLRAQGASGLRCLGYSILSSVPQPIAAVPAFLLVEWFRPLLPFGLGFAGGAMIFLVASELIPESLERASRTLTAWGVMIGMLLMLAISVALGL